MKRITDEELKELPFGSKIKVIWHNSWGHDKNEEHLGVIFADKIGWDNGQTDNIKLIVDCLHNDWCMIYLMTE